jgi:hypothetical protein
MGNSVSTYVIATNFAGLGTNYDVTKGDDSNTG